MDLRLDARGPFAIEVNPNCCLEWHPENEAESAMFPIGARAAGFSFPGLIRELVARALRQRPRLRRKATAVRRVPAA